MQLGDAFLSIWRLFLLTIKLFLNAPLQLEKSKSNFNFKIRSSTFDATQYHKTYPSQKLAALWWQKKEQKASLRYPTSVLKPIKLKRFFSLVSQKPIMWHMEENCNIYLNILTNMKEKDDEITKIEQRKPIHLSTIIQD